jgi:3-hydroxyacyl-[acyl-carrier-protein] dehydratase
VIGPHRPPFRFIDRVVLCEGDRCVAVKGTSEGELLLDHEGGPGAAYPAALVLEALAQAALPLGAEAAAADPVRSPAVRSDGGAPPVLVAIREASVTGPVRIGDRLRITSEIAERFAGMIRIRSRAEVDGITVAEGEFTLAVDLPDPPIGRDGPGEAR